MTADKLRELARQAVADAGPTHRSQKIRAVKLCRDADGARHALAEYVAAVEWVLARPSASSLPDGSVVGAADVVYIKAVAFEGGPTEWRGTNSDACWNVQIDEMLAAGATVLRVGTGEV